MYAKVEAIKAKSEAGKDKVRFAKAMNEAEDNCRKDARLIIRTLEEGMTDYIEKANEEFSVLGDSGHGLDEDDWGSKDAALNERDRMIENLQEGGPTVIDKIKDRHGLLVADVKQTLTQYADSLEKSRKEALGE